MLTGVLSWPRQRFWLLALALGAVDLAVGLLLRGSAAGGWLGLLLTAAFLALTALAGAAARGRGERPGWAGALPALLYGAVGGIGFFFQHETVKQAARLLAQEHLTLRTTPQAEAASANSLAAHLLAYVVTLLFLTLLGILAGSVAGAFVRPRRGDLHAV